jgi:hypothetical protein
MLNADMALVMNFAGSIDSITGEVDCVPGELEGDSNDDVCPEASTIDQVAQYADNNNFWLRDFRDAFVKMTLNGNSICDLMHVDGVDAVELDGCDSLELTTMAAALSSDVESGGGSFARPAFWHWLFLPFLLLVTKW